MYNSLNGPAVYGAITVTSTPAPLRVGGANMIGRVVITFQPTSGIIYYGFDSSVTTSTGTKVFNNQTVYIELSAQQDLYLVSSGNVDVRIAEIG